MYILRYSKTYQEISCKEVRNSKFQHRGLPTDTIIGYFLGWLAGVFVVISIIKSILTQGKVQRVYGVLMVSAMLMAFTGLVFSAIGYRAGQRRYNKQEDGDHT